MLIETILGGLTGLIGNVVGSIFKYKHAQLEKEMLLVKNQHELSMVKAETEAMIMEAKANIAITRAKIEGEIDIADANVYLQSQKEGNKSFFNNKWVDRLLEVQGGWKIITLPVAVLVAMAFGFIDFLRGIIRPTLTVYLVGLSTWVTLTAWKIMQMNGVAMTTDYAVDIFNNITSIVVYLTVSCVTWWFGDRRMAKTIMTLKGADRTKIDDEITI